MDGLKQPVGELSPAVYWRRRIVAFAGTVLVLVVAYFLVVSPLTGSDDTKTGATESPAATVTNSAAPGTAAAGTAARACTAADLAVTVTPNPTDFPLGTLPVFDVSLKNNAASECLVDTAVDSNLLVTSGSDRIFSTTDCADDATIVARQLLLAPGAEEIFQVTWDRKRSAPECTAVDAVPGSGTYKALLTIQGVTASEATFTLSD